MPHIRFDGIEKSFGATRVLAPLDLELRDGEFTVLVGPSGCGKSTTLRILAGLETPSGGEIYFDDKPVTGLASKDRDIAMVFQDYALYPHMNIARNMSFALRLARVPKAEIKDKVQRVAETLNIAHLLDRKPAELSGGQRQRVAMGRALVRDAATFLFDEPLSNLDANLRARMRTELAEMRERLAKNIVYVTHDQVEAMTLGHRIVVLSEGLIQQQGTPEELFTQPANRFVAGFIGSPKMNFLDAELRETGDELRAVGNGFDLRVPDAARARLGARSNGVVEVGVRPSSFVNEADTEPAAGGLDLELVVAEYLGTHSVLVMHCGGEELLVQRDGVERAAPGSAMRLGVKADEIMFFDKASGAAL